MEIPLTLYVFVHFLLKLSLEVVYCVSVLLFDIIMRVFVPDLGYVLALVGVDNQCGHVVSTLLAGIQTWKFQLSCSYGCV